MNQAHRSCMLTMGIAWSAVGIVVGPARAQSVFFSGGRITGASEGTAYNRHNGRPAERFGQGAGIEFSGTGGGGGTSGGLVDKVLVAESSLSLGASITPGGPGVTLLDFWANGNARFLEWQDYDGSMSSFVVADFDVTLSVTVPPGQAMYFMMSSKGIMSDLTGLEHDGVLFPTGSLLAPGEYTLIPGSRSFSCGVTDEEGERNRSVSGGISASFDANGCGRAGAIPSIVLQPQGATGCVGGSVTLRIEVNGLGPLSYRWRRAGVELENGPSNTGSIFEGVRTPAFTISNFQPADTGPVYDCVVSNACATVTSDSVVLGVASAPVITSHPANACPGDPVIFTFGANGTAPFAFQWHRGGAELEDGPTGTGSIIQGARASILRIINAGPADGGSDPDDLYSCAVSNMCGSAATGSAMLCLADFNCDGDVNTNDFFAFLGAFFLLNPAADVNGDAVVNSQDFFTFLDGFFRGC